MPGERPLAVADEDEEFARLLLDLGLPRNVSRALVFMSHVDDAVSAAIERGTGLRQPEVSLAMRVLRERGWVEKRDLKREGKGRPVHCYRLARPLPLVVEEIEAEKRAAAERDLGTLARLRALAAVRGASGVTSR